MKKITLLIIFAICFFCINIINAQGFKKPSEGKAAIYFTRTVTFGSKMLIDIFDGEEYVAYSMGKGYSVYECTPGQHIFWVAGENTDFITADLEAGKVYIAQVYIYPGVMKGRVSLVPNAPTDTKLDGYKASVDQVKAMGAKVMDMKKFKKRKDKFVSKKFMQVKMEGYKKNIEGTNIPKITKEMSVDQKEF